jgi:hypothetical protein
MCGHGCGSEAQEQFSTDKERKGHCLGKVEESLRCSLSKELDRGDQASRVDGCELLLCSTTEEKIGDDGWRATARDGATSLVW